MKTSFFFRFLFTEALSWSCRLPGLGSPGARLLPPATLEHPSTQIAMQSKLNGQSKLKGCTLVSFGALLMLLTGCDLLSTNSGVPKPTGAINVITNPRGCTVMLNGEPRTDFIDRLPAGEYLVSATRRGYKEARKTVHLVEGSETTIELNLEPVKGLVLVHTDPPGVEVLMDGKSIGTSPILLTECDLGEHNLKVAAPGFFEMTKAFDVDNARPIKIEMPLRRNSGIVVVNSEPSGATIRINGAVKGTTPTTIDRLPSGTHKLELELDGYNGFSSSVYLRAGEEEAVNAELVPLPGSLKVVTIPPKARVYVDDQFRGESPLDLPDMEPGDYRVRIEMKGRETLARNVTIEKGQPNTQEFRLESNTGSLKISTEPSGVQIFLDGKLAGITRSKAGNTDQVSEVLEIEELEKGTRTLTVVKKGHAYPKRQIEIIPNDSVTLHIKMERRFIVDTVIKTGTREIKGMLIRRSSNGDVEMQPAPGITVRLKASEIISIKPLVTDEEAPTPRP